MCRRLDSRAPFIPTAFGPSPSFLPYRGDHPSACSPRSGLFFFFLLLCLEYRAISAGIRIPRFAFGRLEERDLTPAAMLKAIGRSTGIAKCPLHHSRPWL